MEQVGERRVNQSLPGDPRLAFERLTFNHQREMTFAAGIVTGMANVLCALVGELEPRRLERCSQATAHFGGDGTCRRCGGGSLNHLSYIVRFGSARKRWRRSLRNGKGGSRALLIAVAFPVAPNRESFERR